MYPANSPNCCSGSYNTPQTCSASGVSYYHYFSQLFGRTPSSDSQVYLHIYRGSMPRHLLLPFRRKQRNCPVDLRLQPFLRLYHRVLSINVKFYNRVHWASRSHPSFDQSEYVSLASESTFHIVAEGINPPPESQDYKSRANR